jgi:mannose-1-phosphate guanylyltransferase
MVEAIRAGGRVGGIVIDEGEWHDLGERDAYLDSLSLASRGFPRYSGQLPERISASARIGEEVEIDAFSTIGAGAVVENGAVIRESVIWPDGVVAAGAILNRTIVRGGRIARGTLSGVDV